MRATLLTAIGRVLPDKLVAGMFFADDQLTHSARQALWRGSVGLATLTGGGVGVLLLVDASWPEVLAGALLAWSVSVPVWAIGSFRRNRDVVRGDLERKAEIDLIHARLNQIAVKVGARTIDLDSELQSAVWARMERLAHINGLEEFRAEGPASPEGWAVWDEDARDTPPFPTA